MLTANQAPDLYLTEIPDNIRRELGIQIDIDGEEQGIGGLYDLAKALTSGSGVTPEQQRCRSSIILPDGINWPYIRFSLLCAGQAYLKTGDKYEGINEPILSTYEICVTYSFSFSLVSSIPEFSTTADMIQYNRHLQKRFLNPYLALPKSAFLERSNGDRKAPYYIVIFHPLQEILRLVHFIE